MTLRDVRIGRRLCVCLRTLGADVGRESNFCPAMGLQIRHRRAFD